MRRNLLLSTASAAAIVLGVVAAAEPAKANGLDNVFGDNWYVTVFGGGAFSFGHANYYGYVYDIQVKDGFTVGGVIGTHVAPGVRFEREISYVDNNHDEIRVDTIDPYDDLDGDTGTIFLLANLWKDLHLGPLSPYFGAGIGTAFVNSEGEFDGIGGGESWDDTAIAFAAQIGGGVRFGLTDRLAVDAGYRFKAAVDASFDGSGIYDENGAFTFYSHIAQVGLTYAMGSNAQVMPAADVAPDEPSWYATLFGGVVFPENTAFAYDQYVYSIDNKTGFTVGAAVGTHLSENLRGELEVSYLRHALDSYTVVSDDPERPADGDLEQIYVLANLWMDFDIAMLSPYVGAGIGVGILNFDDADLDGATISNDTAVGLAGQFGAGVRWSMFDSLAFDLGYRFKSIVNAMVEGDPDNLSMNANVATYNHIVQLGLTYGFGGGVFAEPAADIAPFEETTWYASLFGGVSIPPDTDVSYRDGFSDYLVDFKTGFTVGAAVGTHVMETVRGELEVSYVSYDVDEVDLSRR